MIKQFRKRLIVMTTGFVTLILVAAFATIFLTTYLKQESDNYEKLNQAEQLRITGGNGNMLLRLPLPILIMAIAIRIKPIRRRTKRISCAF